MKYLMQLSLAVLLFSSPLGTSSNAMAQTGPGLQFSDAEKRAIGKYFGVEIQETRSAPTWSVKKGNDDDGRDDDAQDRDENRNKGKSKGKGNAKGKGKSKELPHGLAKRGGDLPPGLQKQLDKNGRLPAGLAKRDLPNDLMSKLPKRPPEQEIKEVEGDVVLMDKATGIILDVLKDVITNQTQPNGSPSSDGPPSQDSRSDGAINSIIKSLFGN